MSVAAEIGGLQRSDIFLPGFGSIDQVDHATCEPRLAELNGEQIADHVRKSSISVRIWVDCEDAVAIAHCDFVGHKNVMLKPIFRVADHLIEFYRDEIGVDADVARRLSVFSSPFPNTAKHSFVQFVEKTQIEHVAFARSHPADRVGNICQLCFVQLRAGGYVGGKPSCTHA